MGSERKDTWIRKHGYELLAFLVIVVVIASLIARPDSNWTWSGPPAGPSISTAPVLSYSQRIRGRLAPGQVGYVRVDPSAPRASQLLINGAGLVDIDEVHTDGRRRALIALEKPPWSEALWIPSWWPFVSSWGRGGDLGDVAYLVVRPVPGAVHGGKYEIALTGPNGGTLKP